MTIHETRTRLAPAEVIERARTFFAHAASPAAAFPEVSGEGFLKLHLDVGEVMIGAMPAGEWTWVRGSASRSGHLLSRFMTTLSQPLDASQTIHRHGRHETRAALVDAAPAPAIAPSQAA